MPTETLEATPAAPPKVDFPRLWVGRIVLFCPHADRSSIPVPAIVQKFDKKGVCSLSVLPDNRISMACPYGVRYMNDPSIATWNEDAKNDCGGWDLVDPEREARESKATKANPHNLPPKG